jgi:hypothetical protein
MNDLRERATRISHRSKVTSDREPTKRGLAPACGLCCYRRRRRLRLLATEETATEIRSSETQTDPRKDSRRARRPKETIRKGRLEEKKKKKEKIVSSKKGNARFRYTRSDLPF